jgi:hypothetical protein
LFELHLLSIAAVDAHLNCTSKTIGSSVLKAMMHPSLNNSGPASDAEPTANMSITLSDSCIRKKE